MCVRVAPVRPARDGRYAEFFRVSDASPETISDAGGGKGMASATFSQHLQAAERKPVAALLDS